MSRACLALEQRGNPALSETVLPQRASEEWGWGSESGSPELTLLPHSFRNVIFDITPGDEAGRFAVNAKFLGVDMEKFQLHYQVKSLITAPARAKPVSAGLQSKHQGV